MTVMIEPLPYAQLCGRLAGLGYLLISLQWLQQRSLFYSGAPLDWELLRQRRSFKTAPIWVPLLGAPGFTALLAVRAAAAVLMLVSPDPLAPIPLAAVVCISLLANLRSMPFGFTGADRMLLIVSGSLVLADLCKGNSSVLSATLLFIALQSVLSYFSAGISKLSTEHWRNGQALIQIAVGAEFTWPWAARLLKSHPEVARAIAWFVVLGQLGFPLILLVRTPSCLGLWLLCGLAFHVAIAMLLRLPNFIWAWGATYPAIAYCCLAR